MFTIGADPELFLKDAAGAFVASCTKIGGSKWAPRPLPIGDGYFVQEDNVAVEYNIPPAQSKEQFRDSILKVMNYLSDMVAQQGLTFSNVSAAEYPDSELWHPLSREFGCDPDHDAWNNGKANPRPATTNLNLRTCGGHVHVGQKFKTMKELIRFIKHADLFMGVPSVLMDDGEVRKQLYGKAGAFRKKPFGCEYRSLSNFWIFSDKHIDWVYDSTMSAMKAWSERSIDIDGEKELILAAINNNNKDAAKYLVKKYDLNVVYA